MDFSTAPCVEAARLVRVPWIWLWIAPGAKPCCCSRFGQFGRRGAVGERDEHGQRFAGAARGIGGRQLRSQHARAREGSRDQHDAEDEQQSVSGQMS